MVAAQYYTQPQAIQTSIACLDVSCVQSAQQSYGMTPAVMQQQQQYTQPGGPSDKPQVDQGEKFVDRSGCRDAPWAVLFYIHLLASTRKPASTQLLGTCQCSSSRATCTTRWFSRFFVGAHTALQYKKEIQDAGGSTSDDDGMMIQLNNKAFGLTGPCCLFVVLA